MRYFVFLLPGSIAHVPAPTEERARQILTRDSYPGAPVRDWPCFTSATSPTWPPDLDSAHTKDPVR